MKCIVCRRKIPKKNNGDICQECDKLLDLFHKNPEEKERTLKVFRDSGRKKK